VEDCRAGLHSPGLLTVPLTSHIRSVSLDLKDLPLRLIFEYFVALGCLLQELNSQFHELLPLWLLYFLLRRVLYKDNCNFNPDLDLCVL